MQTCWLSTEDVLSTLVHLTQLTLVHLTTPGHQPLLATTLAVAAVQNIAVR